MTDEKQVILILHNPKSGSRHAPEIIGAMSSRLQTAGFDVEAYDSLDVFQQRTEQLSTANRLRAVVSAGGDGTASAVTARIALTVPLWLCPLGTENLLARYLGMTSDPDQAVASIARLKTRSFDAGLANGRLFLIMVGVGFDAEVVRQIHAQRRGHIRRWHYWLPILRTVLSYRFPSLKLVAISPIINAKPSERERSQPARVESASLNKSSQAAWYFLLNLPRYASGLDIAPNARGDDGLIDICGFRQGGLFRGFYYYARLRLGTHTALAEFSHQRSSKFRIESDALDVTKISYQLDGDWGGYLPVEIESLPGRLRVIEPIGRPK